MEFNDVVLRALPPRMLRRRGAGDAGHRRVAPVKQATRHRPQPEGLMAAAGRYPRRDSSTMSRIASSSRRGSRHAGAISTTPLNSIKGS